MIPQKVSYGIMGGGAFGAVQVVGLRKLDDNMVIAYTSSLATNISTPPPFLASQLGNFGSPSAIVDLATGISAMGVGYYENRKGNLNDATNALLLGYGATTLAGGILSGLFPTVQWASMVKNLKGGNSSSPSLLSMTNVPRASATLVRSSGSSL